MKSSWSCCKHCMPFDLPNYAECSEDNHHTEACPYCHLGESE